MHILTFLSLFVVFGLVLAVLPRDIQNRKSVGLFVACMIACLVLFCIIWWLVIHRYGGYPTDKRVRNGVCQKVVVVGLPSGGQYLLAYESSGEIRLLPLGKNDITSSTLLLKACSFKKFDCTEDQSFRLFVANEPTTKTICIEKP
jgi:hypothetical protein